MSKGECVNGSNPSDVNGFTVVISKSFWDAFGLIFEQTLSCKRERETHLHFLFPQVDLAGQLFAGSDVGVLGLLEEAFQSLQLLVGEDGSVPPLPAAVQLVEELQLGACEAAHVHVGHHLMRDGRQQHRAGAVVACGSWRHRGGKEEGRGGWTLALRETTKNEAGGVTPSKSLTEAR